MKQIICDACGTTESEIWTERKGKDLCQDCYAALEEKHDLALQELLIERKPK
jgi:NMD protein affecting ribosome stability and mRNA decay